MLTALAELAGPPGGAGAAVGAGAGAAVLTGREATR